MVRRTLVAAIALTLAWAAPASAANLIDGAGALPEPSSPDLIDQAQEDGQIDLERATLLRVYLLTDDARLPAAYESDTPFDGTLAIKRVREALPRMDPGPERQKVAAALGPAPDDPNPSICSTSVRLLPDSVVSDYFYIQYDAATLDASLDINDYAVSLDEAWEKEVNQFGWAAPPLFASAPDDRYHVRIDNPGPNTYGFVTDSGTYAGPAGNNPNTAWTENDADATCMVLNEDYDAFPGTNQAALDATTAHEFNHSLQFGYGALDGGPNEPDDNFVEGGATWMEDEVQDGSNDNYNNLYPTFTSSMGAHTGDEYAYWLTWRGLTERFVTGASTGAEQVMQDFWELTSRNEASSLTAMDLALANKGSSLPRAYHDYAITAKFNAPCGGAYTLPLCFEEGAGYVNAEGETLAQGSIAAPPGGASGSVQDDYALNWITLPNTGSYDVTVRNTSPGGSLRVTLACDTGAGVAIAPVAIPLGPGATGTVPGFNPQGAGCQQTTAVITNVAQTSANPFSSAARSYAVTTVAAAPATTPAVPPEGAGSSAGTTPPTPPAPPRVDPPKPKPSRLAIGLIRVRRNGVVLIRYRVSGAGRLKATARSRVDTSLLARTRRITVARRTVRPRRAGLRTLRLKAGRRARRVIRRNKRRLRATVRLVYRPATGARRTRSRKVTFRLRR